MTSNMNPVGIIGLCILFMWFSTVGICLLVFIRRRHLFPISGRYPGSSIMSCLIACILFFFSFEPLTGFIDVMPCSLPPTLQVISAICIEAMTASRMICMLFQFEQARDLSEDTVSWYTQNRRYGLPRFWDLLVLSLFILITISTVILLPLTSCSELKSIILYTGSGFILAILFVIIGIGVRLCRHGQDLYGLKMELKVYISMLIPMGLLLVYLNTSTDIRIFLTAGSVVVILIQIAWPIYLTYRPMIVIQPEQFNRVEQVLRYPYGYTEFTKYCNSAFCGENPHFYHDVHEYKSSIQASTDPITLTPATLEWIHYIYDMYIGPTSKFQINISAEDLDTTINGIQSLLKSREASYQDLYQVFDLALHEVVQLMQNGPFLQFRAGINEAFLQQIRINTIHMKPGDLSVDVV